MNKVETRRDSFELVYTLWVQLYDTQGKYLYILICCLHYSNLSTARNLLYRLFKIQDIFFISLSLTFSTSSLFRRKVRGDINPGWPMQTYIVLLLFIFFCAIKIVFIFGRFSCFNFHYSVQNAASYTVTHCKALILWTILEIFQNKVKFTIIRCQICGSCWDVLQKFWYKGAWLLEAEVDG